MLYPVNDHMLYVIKRETTRQYRREAEIDHLLDEIDPQQPSWLSYQVRKVLYNLGHLLVTLGAYSDQIVHPFRFYPSTHSDYHCPQKELGGTGKIIILHWTTCVQSSAFSFEIHPPD